MSARSREVLTAEEIAATGSANAYDAIRSCRPQFLMLTARTFGYAARPNAQPVVYLDGIFHGNLESLKTLSVTEIKEIRFIDPKDATLMYGTGNVGGVVLVVTKAH